jgi:predicted adenine nucleotide alpha hydrolase (AANH) superfamily ATPase
MKQKILLHVCCAPCSTHCIEHLMQDYEVTLFYSDSNIFPKEEYERRLGEARKIAKEHNLTLIEDEYNNEAWENHIRGLESEPERGKRCEKCFEFNLGRTSVYAMENGFPRFTTTLTIAPQKDSKLIFSVAQKFPNFLALDFKKQDGFKHSLELSLKHNLYRQNYCGCRYSIR